jgi:hypothetical protein
MSSSNAAAIRRRSSQQPVIPSSSVNNRIPPQQPPANVQQQQSPQQGTTGLTLQQALSIIDARLTKLETAPPPQLQPILTSISGASPTDDPSSADVQTIDITEYITETNSRFEIFASEMMEMKTTVQTQEQSIKDLMKTIMQLQGEMIHMNRIVVDNFVPQVPMENQTVSFIDTNNMENIRFSMSEDTSSFSAMNEEPTQMDAPNDTQLELQVPSVDADGGDVVVSA